MAVLVEGISVVVRRDRIDERYPGAWAAFTANAPNGTLCTDGELARVGFLDPGRVRTFVDGLSAAGLTYLSGGRCADLAVVDQLKGIMMPCDWLEFARLSAGEAGETVGACWIYEGRRLGCGVHVLGRRIHLATPAGWQFEESLSQKHRFVPDPSLRGHVP